jgi:hypothetical protein
MTMNAFHPDYVQTHMPDFMSNFRRESHAITEGKKAAARPRKTRELDGQIQAEALSSPAKRKKRTTYPAPRIDLAPRQYRTYSKAGAK